MPVRPFIPAANTVRADFVYNFQGLEAENVFHMDVGHSPVAADLASIIGSLQTLWTGTMKPYYYSQIRVDRIKATDISVAGGLTQTTVITPQVYGTSGNVTQGAQICAVAKLQTGFAGRSRRGRIYWPFVNNGLYGANRLNAPGKAAFAAITSALLAAFSGTSGTPRLSVVSYQTGGAWRTSALVTPITSYAVNDLLGTQRGRLIQKSIV